MAIELLDAADIETVGEDDQFLLRIATATAPPVNDDLSTDDGIP